MSKTEQIKKLLEDNKVTLLNGDKDNGICYDGIINESKFKDLNVKLMFLLKETNGNDSKGNSQVNSDWVGYVEWLKNQQANINSKETLYKTFFNACMWIEEFYSFVKNKTMSFEEYAPDGQIYAVKIREQLNNVALVNLKKTWGGSSTSWNNLNTYLSNNDIVDILKKEIEIISPDIVLCGGVQVFDFAKKMYAAQSVNSSNLEYFLVNKTVFVKFRHPALYWRKRKNHYDYAADIFKQMKTEKLM